jgi:hypothetical protein
LVTSPEPAFFPVRLQPKKEKALSLEFAEMVPSQFGHYHAFRMSPSFVNYVKTSRISRTIRFSSESHVQSGPRMEEGNISETAEILRFEFILAAEPRLTILWTGPPELLEAIDDQSCSLVDPKNRGVHFRQVPNRRLFMVHGPARMLGVKPTLVPIRLPPTRPSAHTIKSLRFTVPVTLQTRKTTTVLVDDIKSAVGKEFKLANSVIRINSFMKGPATPGSRLLMTLTGKENANLVSDEGPYEDLEFQDTEGKPCLPSAARPSRTAREMHLEYLFGSHGRGGIQNEGPPAKILYVKTECQVYDLPFEFKDLPLP